ncbi:MAG: DNA-directed RNA polymerase subunit F [Candidatus Aenigmarchaeota archaeon]|nr:DNA-directed RNA polymerase subunit F [Candidatus Aenigmarchaeota archaeon]
MNVLAEEVITDSDAEQMLEKRAKETELKYEQKNALEILRKFVKVEHEKIKILVEELKKIERLRDRQIVAIANFLPQDKEDLKAVLHKEYTSFTPEEIEKILETVKRTI